MLCTLNDRLRLANRHRSIFQCGFGFFEQLSNFSFCSRVRSSQGRAHISTRIPIHIQRGFETTDSVFGRDSCSESRELQLQESCALICALTECAHYLHAHFWNSTADREYRSSRTGSKC